MLYTGKLALYTARVEEVSNPRKGPNSSTRRTMTPHQFPVTSSNRTSPMVLNMELPTGSECAIKQRRCCRKLANPSMVVPKPSRKDGTRVTITESLCQILDERANYPVRQLHWKTTPKLHHRRKESREKLGTLVD